jgi:hydrogenase nickel incorporation protein HypA/HybF
MHELSVTESILEISLRHAGAVNAKKITNLYLVIGQLASIVDDSVQFYWDIISKDTIAEGAQLHFRRLPAKLACLDCDNQYTPIDGGFSCPNCTGQHVKVISGDEFFMEAIDVDSEEMQGEINGEEYPGR